MYFNTKSRNLWTTPFFEEWRGHSKNACIHVHTLFFKMFPEWISIVAQPWEIWKMCVLLVKINRLFWDIYTKVLWHLMLNFPPLGMLKNRRNRGVFVCFFLIKELFYFHVSAQLQKFLTMLCYLLYFCLWKILQEEMSGVLRTILFWFLYTGKKIKTITRFWSKQRWKNQAVSLKANNYYFSYIYCTSFVHLWKQIIHGNIMQLDDKINWRGGSRNSYGISTHLTMRVYCMHVLVA